MLPLQHHHVLTSTQYIMDPQTALGTPFIDTPGILMDVAGLSEASQVSTPVPDSLNSLIASGAANAASLQASQIVRDLHFLKGRMDVINYAYAAFEHGVAQRSPVPCVMGLPTGLWQQDGSSQVTNPSLSGTGLNSLASSSPVTASDMSHNLKILARQQDGAASCLKRMIDIHNAQFGTNLSWTPVDTSVQYLPSPFNRGLIIHVSDQVFDDDALGKTEEEFVLAPRQVDNRKVDIILHRGYEYCQGRGVFHPGQSQRWICRHAGRFKCKGKLLLVSPNKVDFMDGASISGHSHHNHDPYRAKNLDCPCQQCKFRMDMASTEAFDLIPGHAQLPEHGLGDIRLNSLGL